LTKTDDILAELNKKVAKHITGVRPFLYKKKTYRLVDNYVAVPYMKCDLCGNYPTYEVSVIESEDGKTLRVGNDCIDHLTGENVSEYFKSFRVKRENALANRETIDQQ
jgi:hypothetical protein